MTEPKVFEDALRRSEETYRVLFQKNPNPVWVCDAETLRILAVNEGAMRVYGYAREEFLGLTLADLHVSDDVPSLLEHASSPQPELVDAGVWRHRKKGGTIIDVELVSQEIQVDGTRALLAMAIDVMDRRRAEEALRRGENGEVSMRMVMALDITARKRAEEEVRRMNEDLERRVVERTAELEDAYHHLQALSAHLQSVREQEQARIAREIHDELGQALTGLKFELSRLAQRLRGHPGGGRLRPLRSVRSWTRRSTTCAGSPASSAPPSWLTWASSTRWSGM